jgi:hypothetical protein
MGRCLEFRGEREGRRSAGTGTVCSAGSTVMTISFEFLARRNLTTTFGLPAYIHDMRKRDVPHAALT